MDRTIGILVGSLRRNSYSKAIAKAVSERLPENIHPRWIELGELPLFNQDFDDDGNTPDSWKRFRQAVQELDAFLFVTPEYNRSFPPVLKNALDIASRPYGQNMWSGKPGAVISVSPGRIGGFGANHHLRQVLSFLNIYTMQQPEGYVGDVGSLVDEQGALREGANVDFLQGFAEAFADWVRRFNP